LVLLTSAALKTAEYLAQPPARRWDTVLFVVGIAWVASWLLTGVAPRIAWIVTLIIFSGLASYLGSQIFLGAASCGCFGKFHPPIGVIFAFDASAVVALLLSYPGVTARPGRGWVLGVLAAVAAATMGVLLLVP
jgi:hypothetical protein